MKLEETCLTIEQAKELEKLGINFSSSLYCFYGIAVSDRGKLIENISYELCLRKEKVAGIVDTVPTLTNTELLDILPESIKYISKDTCLSGIPGFDDELPYEKRPPLEYCLEFGKTGGSWLLMYSVYGTDDCAESIPHSTEPNDQGFYDYPDREGIKRILFRDALFEMIKWLKTNKLM
jgi:hypothetical protein